MTSSVTVDERASTSSQASHLRIPSPHERPVSQGTWEVKYVPVAEPVHYVFFHPITTSFTDSIYSAIEAPDKEFGLLADRWRRETGMLSSISRKAMHPAYQRIIGMGVGAIVPILQELQMRSDHWFWALNAITGENPVPEESLGNLGQMADAWILWGRKRGYLS